MSGSEIAALFSLSLAQFTTTLEFTIVYIALPSIGSELALRSVQLQWVASAYAVLFGGFLLLCGRLSDRFGARRLFLAAVLLFASASAAGAIANGAVLLLAARAGQGLAAAMLQPAVLGLLQSVFQTEPARSRAWGLWSAIGASGLGAGALLGGVLTEWSWRLTFAINIPLMVVCAVGALVWLTPDQSRTPARVPITAAGLAVGAALSLSLGLTAATEQGWQSPTVYLCLLIATVLGIAFTRNESVPHRTLFEPQLRRVHALWTGAGVTALYMASAGSSYYLLTLLFQDEWSYSALDAGIAFLPLAAAIAAGSALAGSTARRHGVASVLVIGFALCAGGLGWLAVTATSASYPLLLAGLLTSGAGNGLVFTSMFILGTRDVPADSESTAGGVLATSQYLSSTLALAVLTLLMGHDIELQDFPRAFLALTLAAVTGVTFVLIRNRR